MNLKKALVLFFLFFLGFIQSSSAVELRFWNFWNSKFILPVISAFEAENPGIKIINEQLNWGNGLDKIVVALANHQAPDICELGSTWSGKFMAGDSLLDLTDDLKPLVPDYMMWEPVTWKGRLYGMPWLVGTRVLFYNRALLRSCGFDPDKPPETWSQFLEVAGKIYNPKKGIYGFGINAGEGNILYKKFLPFVWGNNGTIMRDDQTWTFKGPKVEEAFEFYRKLAPFGLKEKQDLLDEAFMKGKLGLEISGSWTFPTILKEAPDLDFGVALIPRPENPQGHTASFLGGEILVAFRSCKDKQAAVKFIKFLTRAENTFPITKETLVSFPADKIAFSDPFFTANPKLSLFIKQMETGVHPPVDPLWVEMESIINDAVEKITYGEEIKPVLESAEKAFEELKAQNQKRNRERKNSSQPKSVTEPPPFSLPTWIPLIISVLAIGVIVNAIFSFMILSETKRNRTSQKTQTGLKTWEILVCMFPWIATFFVFWLYPLIFSFLLSFCDYDVLHPENWRFVGFENFSRLLYDPKFSQSFGNTIFFVIGTTPVITVLALALALLINELKSYEQLFRSAFFLPSIISIVVISTIFKYFYSPQGSLNYIFALFGLPEKSWLVDPAFAMPAIMIMDIWSSIGYYLVLFLAALKAIPVQYFEAAKVDGASYFQTFRHITIPHIKPMILFVLVINTIRAWQVFPEIFTLTKGGPLGTTDTIVHRLYETAFRFHEMGYASAMAYVLFAVIFALSWFQIKLLGKERGG
ncbi:MAG: extracellular solute-binding protein [Candidatus Riflebacteria bacterium]|nr:extracellular solute-binding protein [Candidatus Riflebacteria bacterium]